MPFQCNICGGSSDEDPRRFNREKPTCAACGSSLRSRSLTYLLSLELFGAGIPLPSFPTLKEVCGLGLSDWEGYARRLAEKFDYRNTFFHQAPRFDINDPPAGSDGQYDFITAAEIFEHVPPPAAAAIANAFRLLKPAGVLVMSVPWLLDGETREHFPNLYHFEVVNLGGAPVLVNRRSDGGVEVFDSLSFHGGHGSTVEMRVFTLPSLLDNLRAAGFAEIKILREEEPRYGIVRVEDYSLPIAARKGPFAFPREWAGRLAQQLAAQTECAARYLAESRRLEQELQERAKWTRELDQALAEARTIAAERERELEERGRWALAVDAERAELARLFEQARKELEERTAWALRLQQENDSLAKAVEASQAESKERTEWALRLDQELAGRTKFLEHLRGQLEEAQELLRREQAAMWSRIGRRLGLLDRAPGS